MSTTNTAPRGRSAKRGNATPLDLDALPDNALLTDAQKAAHSGFSIYAFRKWRADGKGQGPATIYLEGRPRSTVGAYRQWLATARGAGRSVFG